MGFDRSCSSGKAWHGYEVRETGDLAGIDVTQPIQRHNLAVGGAGRALAKTYDEPLFLEPA